MNPDSRAVGAGGGRWLVVGLALAEVAAERALTNVLRVAAYVTVPGVVLIAGGYRLPTTQISPRYFPAVGGWCLAGVAVMLAGLTLYQLEPAESVTDPAQGALVLTAFGSVAGFGVDSRDALAKMRARALQRRNGELERTEARLAETVERLEAANDALAASNAASTSSPPSSPTTSKNRCGPSRTTSLYSRPATGTTSRATPGSSSTTPSTVPSGYTRWSTACSSSRGSRPGATTSSRSTWTRSPRTSDESWTCESPRRTRPSRSRTSPRSSVTRTSWGSCSRTS